MSRLHVWFPAGALLAGCLLLLKVGSQRHMPLAGSLESLPAEIDEFHGVDRTIGAEEQRVAGMSNYLMRIFTGGSGAGFSIYVGYYTYQTQGKTIHSPKNCLPGAGWEPVESRETEIVTDEGRSVPINRYLLVNGDRRALVYYWYQGRGRVTANEYRVKLNLLTDSALHGRSEEALVRIVIPISERMGVVAADSLARRVAAPLVGQVAAVLPT